VIDQGLRMSSQASQGSKRVALALRPDHTQEKPLAQETDQGPDLSCQML
jgi:hypothetical protein